MPKSTEQVRREYRESMGRVADFAEQHNKSAFFKRLFDHGDLSEREMMDALRLAPEDGAGERAAAAEAYMAKHAKPPQDDRQSREDERAKAEAERLWASLHGAPRQVRDYRLPAERALHESFAAIGADVVRQREFHNGDDCDAALAARGAEAARRLWSRQPTADPAENLRSDAPGRKGR